MTELELCATGFPLLRHQVRAIDPALRELIGQTRQELQVATFLLLESAGELLALFEKALERGVKTTIVVNRLSGHPLAIRGWVERITKTYGHIRILDYADPRGGQLHAKVVVCDRSSAMIGSANLTSGGMNLNIEMGVIVRGRAAWKAALLVDRIAQKAAHFGSDMP